jgi:type VI secretion system (T6SS) phospholipase Tle1-like effector
MAEPKDIILLIDGTCQGPENSTSNPTNVEGLAYFLKAEPLRTRETGPRPLPEKNGLRADAPGTVVGYLSGVGADTPAGVNLLAAATGWGTAETIRLAYKFVISHYQPKDRIFLFGFSRGAFAVRSFAGFVDCIGVGLRAVPADRRDLAIAEAYYAYEYLQGDTKMLRENIREYVQEYLPGGTRDATPELIFTSLPIYFIGIWDAVGALGLPSKAAFTTDAFNSYHQTRLPPNVSNAFHALSLHELRSDFSPHVWTNKLPDQTLEQRWFAGDHSDIGGGHETRELADISLAWMLRKAESVGLAAVNPLSKEILSPPVGPVVHQIWQQRPYCLLNPAIRDILKTYGDPAGPALLGSSFDDTVLDRLAFGDVDYSAWRIGWGRWFGRSEHIQAHALQDVDRQTIRGLLRNSPEFTRLDEQRQKSLLASMNAANWRDAQAALSKEHGEQLSAVALHGIPHPTRAVPKINLKTTPKPPSS